MEFAKNAKGSLKNTKCYNRAFFFPTAELMSSLTAPFKSYLDRCAITLLFLGFSAGIPILLIFSTLSLWLLEAGVKRDMVTMFSWAALGYSFKFVWSPLIDALPVPVLGKMLGQRRSWLLVAQCLIVAAVLIMAGINPQLSGSLNFMALGAVLLGFSSATQDVVIDAYRIEIAPDRPDLQAVMSSTYTAGYRIGMIVAGAGSLLLAAYFGSAKGHYVYAAWRNTYWIMACTMGIGITTTLLIREPEIRTQKDKRFGAADNLRLLLMFVLAVGAFVQTFRNAAVLLPETSQSPLLALAWETLRLGISLAAALIVGWLVIRANLVRRDVAVQAWIEPLADFFRRYGKRAALLLALIGLYRIIDIVSGVISNVFYADMGFSKQEIAWAVKTFGVAMSIGGGFAGGILAQRCRIMHLMMFGTLASCSTHLLFAFFATRGHNVPLMYTAVGLDNFASGFAGTIFVAFLSSLTSIRFTAVQYALFSSLMTLLPKTIGGYSGSIVGHIGYSGFFLFTAALGLPILLLTAYTDKVLFRSGK